MEKKLLITVPGQRLCLSDEKHIAGHGTYERQGYIYSMLAGTVDIIKKDKVKVIEVRSCNEQTVVPAEGDIVTAKIAVINQSYCKCHIKCIGDVVLSRNYRGILRKENVRATQKDSVQIFMCFKPGDIILARVLPITEAHTYQLSTAENELGVVIAYSKAGIPMVPVSWTEMQCPKTFEKHNRKVAKVVPENINEENTMTFDQNTCNIKNTIPID